MALISALPSLSSLCVDFVISRLDTEIIQYIIDLDNDTEQNSLLVLDKSKYGPFKLVDRNCFKFFRFSCALDCIYSIIVL